MDAVALAEAIRSKSLSPSEVLDAHLERIAILEPFLHSFCLVAFESARREAREVGDRILRGDVVGPLAGIPIGIKDLVCTAGLTTTGGSIAYRDFVPDEDDVVVERIKSAGAIIVGKTNVSELGYGGIGHNPVFETTRNPWNTDLTPGGSSAGSGSAVASGEVPFAVGSDGGGSIRIPSAHSGIFGMKPSMGRVPLYPGCRDERYPGLSSWESLEHLGPMSRTVADSALLLSVMAGPDPRDRHSLPEANFDWRECVNGDLKGLRVAYSPDWGYAAVDPQVRRVVDEAVKVFERDLGCSVEIAHPGWSDPSETFAAIVAMDSDLEGMRDMVKRFGSQMSPHLVALVQRPWTAEEFTNAGMARKALANKMWRFMSGYDLLLTPTLAVPPFPVHSMGPATIDGRSVGPRGWSAFVFPINLTGQPAASVPAGFTEDGLPVGLQIVGRHLADQTVLKASAAFERVRPWRDRWPSLLAEKGLIAKLC